MAEIGTIKTIETDIMIMPDWVLPMAYAVSCAVCGAIEGIDTIEVFGKIQGIELGCAACIGVVHFPDHNEVNRRLQNA